MPKRQAVELRVLGFQIAVVHVALVERHGAAHRLQIVAASARGALVGQHVRVAAAEIIPIGQVSDAVPNFGNALRSGASLLRQ